MSLKTFRGNYSKASAGVLESNKKNSRIKNWNLKKQRTFNEGQALQNEDFMRKAI
jgi:hypothetical protein